MKKFRNKKFNRKKSHYRSNGELPGQVSFEDVAPRDVKSSYGPRDQEYSPGFHKRAFKDLLFGQVTLKINPNEDAGMVADPYAIIGPTNKVIDANYNGEDNENGSICQQLNLGSGSNFANVADVISEEIFINYNYCKHTSGDNASPETNNSYYYPWADIDSSIQAEAFYDLPFFKWVVDPASTTYYTDPLLDIIDFYQVVLQATYQIPLRYKILRSMEKELKDMCYQRGDSILNDIYARLKKKTLLGTINGITDAVANHFLDRKWFEEVSLLLAQPCKKAVGMLDPLMELKVKYDYNNNLLVKDSGGKTLVDTSSTTYSDLFAKINRVLDNLSIQTVLQMARTNAGYSTIQNWMNLIVSDVADIKNDLQEFTEDFADLVVAFKRMEKAGYTNWQLGQFMLLEDISETFKPEFNKMVFDIIRNTFTGSKNITYNPKINKWVCLSIWDKYIGIPTYDEKQGGSVLTFSTKTVVNSSGLSLPYAAWFKFSSCKILTRKGEQYDLTIYDTQVNSGAIARVLGRLSPLNTTDSEYFHCPSIDLSALSAAPVQQAWITEAIQHVFGYLRVQVSAGTYNYCISDDILTSVDCVINDMTNAIDSQGRMNAPFKVLKAVTKPMLGISKGQ